MRSTMYRIVFIFIIIHCHVSAWSDNRDNNLKIYNNYGGNSQHNGYLKLSDDGHSSFKYPLQQKWVNPDIKCVGGNIDTGNVKLFINNTFYCISEGYNVTAVNPLNGELIWTTNIPDASGTLDGLQCTSNGKYIAVVANYGNPDYKNNINILQTSDGSIVSNTIIDLPLNSKTFITSYNNIFYALWTETGYRTAIISAGLITIDPENKIVDAPINITNIWNSVNTDYSSLNVWPTFCVNGEVLLLTDIFNYFIAYNSSTFKKVWSKNMTYGHLDSNAPPICMNDKIIWAKNVDLYPILDAITGEELYQINYVPYGIATLSPVVFHADKNILVGGDIVAYDISDATNPKILWNVTGDPYDELFAPLVIDNSFLFVNLTIVNLYEYGTIVVRDIDNGQILWQCDCCAAVAAGSNYGNVVTPGIDENNNAILMVVDPNGTLISYQ